MKKWLVKSIDKNASFALSKSTGLPSLICDLLVSRGVTSVEKANTFFKGNEISDPLLIKDMDRAVQVIEEAIENGDKITVYGDYDCDGVTATVMLFSHLEALGAEVDWYIPTRDEGYGLNKEAVKKLADSGTNLIITVDNGVSAVEEAEYIYELSMKLVVTDHHTVPDILPRAEAIVNPHRNDDTSDCKNLAGCGVVLKLIMALEQDTENVLEQYADIASIGTVGDVVPLTGENRIIVREGLALMECSENAGIVSLIEASGLDKENMTASAVAFGLCPRINAAGRHGDPSAAAELLLADTLSAARAKADRLCALNTKRKEREAEIIALAQQKLMEDSKTFNSPVIIVSGEGWEHGIVGIVGAKLLELYGKPVITIAVEGETARGSARSIDGFSIYNAILSAEDLLLKFGGHTMAAGFTIKTADIEEFKKRINDYAYNTHPVMPVRIAEADKRAEKCDIEVSQVEQLKYLEPFGEENPQPLFCFEGCVIVSSKPLKNGKFTTFTAQYEGKTLKFLCFSIPYESFTYLAGDKVDVMANLEINEYNDNKSVVAYVRELRSASVQQDKYFAAKGFYEKILSGRSIDPRLEKRIIPSKDEMKIIFDLCRQMTNIEAAAEKAADSGINYCMFMITLHVFSEYGHLELDRVHGTMKFLQGGRRVELETSGVIRAVRRCITQ